MSEKCHHMPENKNHYGGSERIATGRACTTIWECRVAVAIEDFHDEENGPLSFTVLAWNAPLGAMKAALTLIDHDLFLATGDIYVELWRIDGDERDIVRCFIVSVDDGVTIEEAEDWFLDDELPPNEKPS